MTNLIKSHSFIVKKANGIDDFRIQLRASYWNKIKSERALRRALESSFDKGNNVWYDAMKKHYDNNNILYVLRCYGMIAGSQRLTNNEKY